MSAGDSPPPEWTARLARWLIGLAPKTRRGRIVAYSLLALLILVPSAALLTVTVVIDRRETEAWFEALGYPGIFLSNLLGTGTVFLPVPGLLAVGQALIISGGDILNPLAVGLVGGFGMGLGESTAYLTGLAGSEIVGETQAKGPRWLQPALEWVIRTVDRLMERYWLPTLFILSVVPDPVFEFAGISAGASRIGFWRFMAVVGTGNCIRGLLLAYFGHRLLPFL